jgi:hypothetical protein
MHRDHDIFVKSIQGRTKVKVTFVTNDHGDIGDGLFGPIFYLASVGGGDSGCYYLWDFESETGDNFLGLPSSQIVSMELAAESFDLVELLTSKREISDFECRSREN